MITGTMNNDNQHIDPVGLLPKVFAGEASPEEARLIEEWRSSNPDNQAEYEAIEKLWNVSAEAAEPEIIDIDSEWRRMEAAMAPAYAGKSVLMRIMQIAASLLIITVLGFMAIKFSGIKSEKAPAASLASVILPDGTRVSLNAGSVISYKKGFGTTHRSVNLKGEAFFEVSRVTDLPFVISAGEARVKVTGTKFNVKAYHRLKEIRVTVTEGTVRFYYNAEPAREAILQAGETGILNKDHVLISRANADLNDIAWKTGILDFHDTPLSEVTEIINNTYHCRISLDTAIENCPVTVRFDNRKLDAVLNVLRSTLDLKIATRGKRIIISGKGC
jgi:ferric-dicitrate binding protein FerR (iron transport regulator)